MPPDIHDISGSLTCPSPVPSIALAMLDVIEKLLVLQDRDRKIRRARAELAAIDPQRQAMKNKASGAQAALDKARQRVKDLEAKRNQLELEVESKKDLINKYGQQQFQTRKNDEYRALAKEIEHCKADITRIEDQEIELMEQAEQAAKDLVEAGNTLKAAQAIVDGEVKLLDQGEQNLKKDLTDLESNRGE